MTDPVDRVVRAIPPRTSYALVSLQSQALIAGDNLPISPVTLKGKRTPAQLWAPPVVVSVAD